MPSSRLYPELEFYERGDLAYESLTAAKHQVMKTWRFWLTVVEVLVLYVLSCLIILWLLMHYAYLPPRIDHILSGGAVAFVGGGGIEWWIFRDHTRRHIRERLVELGIPICVPCGYDLRGQTDPRCPECGTEFDPKLLKEELQSSKAEKKGDCGAVE